VILEELDSYEMAPAQESNIWLHMNYLPPRGSCNHKDSILTPKCPCLRFMIHPLQVSFYLPTRSKALEDLLEFNYRPRRRSSVTAADIMLVFITWRTRQMTRLLSDGRSKKRQEKTPMIGLQEEGRDQGEQSRHHKLR
jgi:hypothetical protein